MIKCYVAPQLSAALEQFKDIVRLHAEKDGGEGKRLVVFCEDRLSLVAERAVCDAVGGTFAVSVYTLSRFLATEKGVCDNVLSSRGSAMAIRKLIEDNRESLQLFRRLSAAAAAQDVYDTIALLYSSKISAEDLSAAEAEGGGLLKRKLHDLQLLYRAYSGYLEERGAIDRNAYLRSLPEIIRSSEKIDGASVVFLGFQAFTSTVADCVRACMQTAENVYGALVGGSEKKYVNEAWTTFVAIAGELKLCDADGKGVIHKIPSRLIPAAETIRKYVFEPECFHKPVSLDICGGQLYLLEAADEEEQCRYIASQIVKCVQNDGVRYREISVMLPDIAACQPILERAFGEYEIPMYVDRRYPLSTHCVCSFILDYLACASDGCTLENVLAAVSSPLFTFDCDEGRLWEDKGIFINYMLRAATYRGAVKKPASEEICKEPGLDYATVERVRSAFCEGLKILPQRESDCSRLCASVVKLLEHFNAKDRLAALAAAAEEEGFNSVGVMSARAYDETLKVLAEAEKLTEGERSGIRAFAKLLKSGFTAAEISLIPPKQDAVFIGDLSTCANAGSKILFVGGLTDAVPRASQDTAILTDGELDSLGKLKLAVSPKISQVNRRIKETTALNLCAFSQKLYLISPLRSGGEECARGEVTGYIRRLFTVDGKRLTPLPCGESAVSEENFVYTCSHSAPALRYVTLFLSGDRDYGERRVASVYRYWRDKFSYADPVDETNGDVFGQLYANGVTPTALENYYSCPYRAFLGQGLRLAERREGAFRPLDSGNFIHAVLEEVAKKLNTVTTREECEAYAEQCARTLLSGASFVVDGEDGGASYAAEKLVEEAKTVSLGMFEQLAHSQFTVESTETKCRADVGGYVLGGRIDRVDACGDLVRVIDYKTGTVDDSPSSYYMGLKLQLPLYLSAVSKGRRAVGAYYFPANIEYTPDGVGAFTLKGFMDGSEEVVRSSDVTVRESCKSAYVNAYLNGKKLDKAMSREDFEYFLKYSGELARRGARELTLGHIAPSPVKDACKYCKYGGCCGYDAEARGEREEVAADCKGIAAIMRENENKGGDGQ